MNENKFDFRGLAEILRHQASTIIQSWLPGGQISGNEYLIGDIHGNPGKSMKINLISGKWCDFATSTKGTDLIALYAAMNDISMGEAYNILANDFNFIGNTANNKPKTVGNPSIIQNDQGKVSFIPPPKGSMPTLDKKPSGLWHYKDRQGNTLFLITRYESEGGKKFYQPWSFTSDNRWVKKAWKAPRPLYNLDIIEANPTKSILLVEGEKAADAANAITGGKYIATTWPGGSMAWDKADLSPIYNRNILIWPDNDEAGLNCAEKISNFLNDKPHKSLKLIYVKDKPKKWDAHDALNEGMNWDSFKTWAKENIYIYGEDKIFVKPKLEPVPEEPKHKTDINALSFIRSQKGVPLPHDYNAMIAIEHLLGKDIWYDEFYNEIRILKDNEIKEYSMVPEATYITATLQTKYGMSSIKKGTVHDAIVAVAMKRRTNEPREWLKSLKWDGIKRLDNFFSSYMGAKDTDYTRAVSKNWWVSMVARVFHPGCKVDNMVILEGKQGRYKSTALQIIGGKWYAELTESMNSKDFYQVFPGKLLLEIGELDAFNKSEATRIKQVISSASDRYRASYGKKAADYPRQTILVGTTNEHHYLKDKTGNRRFWPIAIDIVNIKRLEEDRDQLFAEAVIRYNAGETWHEVPKSALIEQEDRAEIDVITEMIAEWLSLNQKSQTTPKDIILDCLDMKHQASSRALQNQVIKALSQLRWHRGAPKHGKRPWYPEYLDSEGNLIK